MTTGPSAPVNRHASAEPRARVQSTASQTSPGFALAGKAAKDRIIPATKMPMPVAHFCMKKYPAKKSPSDRRPVSLCEASTTSAIIDEERIIRMIENVLLTKTRPNIPATLGLTGRDRQSKRRNSTQQCDTRIESSDVK